MLELLLQGITPAAELGSMSGQFLDYVKFLFILLGILLLTFVAVRFWVPRLLGGARVSSSGPIQVVARLPLEPRKTLHIVKVGNEFSLIGTSEGQIQYLRSVEADQIAPLLEKHEAHSESRKEFGRLLKSLRAQRN